MARTYLVRLEAAILVYRPLSRPAETAAPPRWQPPFQAADGARALSSACCCSLVRFVLSTVPPNLAISGNTRSWLVLRAITKSAEPPGWMDASHLLDPLVVHAVIAEVSGEGAGCRSDRHPGNGDQEEQAEEEAPHGTARGTGAGQAGALMELHLAVLRLGDPGNILQLDQQLLLHPLPAPRRLRRPCSARDTR